jgi:hypothetical protein
MDSLICGHHGRTPWYPPEPCQILFGGYTSWTAPLCVILREPKRPKDLPEASESVQVLRMMAMLARWEGPSVA